MEYASLTARSMAWWSQPMNALRRLRLEIHLSQCEFAARLGVSEQTYRTWDSGRRRPPRAVVYLARRFKETEGGKLQSLQVLATEYHVHVRTLRKAASRRSQIFNSESWALAHPGA